MKSAKAEDNIGLAYRYAEKYCPSGTSVMDSEAFSDALLGLCKAERDYDPNRINPDTGKPYAFTTCAWRYMFTECYQGYQKRLRLNRVQCLNFDEWYKREELKMVSSPEEDTIYIATAMVKYLQSLVIEEEDLQKDLDVMLTYYLRELTLKEVGDIFGISKEKVRQRIIRIKDHIAQMIDYCDFVEQNC